MKFITQLLSEMEIDFDTTPRNSEENNPAVGDNPPAEDKEQTASGFNINIEQETIDNTDYRRVLFTTEKTQLVLMSIPPNEDIGMETHDGDQFFRFEKGEGIIVIDGNETEVTDGSAAVVREGAEHNVINTSDSDDLKLYAIYAPPQHKDGTIDKTKADENPEEDIPDRKVNNNSMEA